jgi:hypothetical protein
MPIIDVSFTKLEASRGKTEKAPKNVEVGNNSRIVEIKKKKIPNLGDAIIIDYEFTTKYKPEIGNILVGGRIVFHDKKIKDIIEEKKGKISFKSADAFQEIQNMILGTSTVQALMLAKELKLPSPIQLPKVAVKKEVPKKGYA